jgi:hypothetical protein
VHDHLEEGDGGDSDVFEVVRVGLPGFGFLNCFLLGGVVCVEGVAVRVDEFDIIVELCLRR